MAGQPRSGAAALVYSTDGGRMCPGCRKPLADCVCQAARAAPVGDGIARISREKKGRGGKTVTVVRGLVLEPAAIQALARRLKTLCGVGGTVADGVLELQGDQVERVVLELQAQGLKARRAGG